MRRASGDGGPIITSFQERYRPYHRAGSRELSAPIGGSGWHRPWRPQIIRRARLASSRYTLRNMSATSPIFLSIIVPAYNEAATIVNTLTRIRSFLERRSTQYEVIVSADGEDDTRRLASEFAGRDTRFKFIGSPQ